MAPDLSARRRAQIVMAVMSALLTNFPTASQAQTAGVDTAKTHDFLRDAINDFQGKWRKPWRELEFGRYGPLVAQAAKDALDPQIANTRRVFALACETETPLVIPHAYSKGRVVIVARYPVTLKPDRGSICPMYFPPLEEEVPDESANIDLAIPYSARNTIRNLRASLISRMSGVLAANPTDEWVAGQLVRFTYDQNDAKKTVAAAAGPSTK